MARARDHRASSGVDRPRAGRVTPGGRPATGAGHLPSPHGRRPSRRCPARRRSGGRRRPRARRRLRGAVRAADRPPRPRARRLLRDRAAPDPGRGGGGALAVGGDPVGRPEERARGARAQPRPGGLRPRRPHPRHLLRRAAHRPAARWHRRPRVARRVRTGTPHPPRRDRVGAARRRRPERAGRLDEPLRRDHGGARRLRRDREHPGRTGRRAGGPGAPDLGGPVPPRGRPHARRHRAPRPLPAPRGRAADVDDGIDHRPAGRRRARAGRHGPGDLRAERRGGLRGRGRARAPGHRPAADVRVRRHRPHAPRRERAGRRDLPAEHGDRADPRGRGRPLLRAPGRRHRPGGEAQGDRRAVRPHLRGAHRRAHRCDLPGAGHALPRRDRERRQRRHRGRHQEPPQRRRPARGHDAHARRAVAPAVQGRGAPARPRARPARRDRLAAAVPRARPRRPDHRRGHARARLDPAGRRRDRPRGDRPRRAGARAVAGVRGAGRHPLRGRDGGRADLRAPDHRARRHQRRRDDRRLGTAALRPARDDLEPDHQRGPRREPRRLRHHLEAARHDRVGERRRHAAATNDIVSS